MSLIPFLSSLALCLLLPNHLSAASVLFSTKTAYKLVENLDLNVTKPAGCKEVQINVLFRHGTRYPSDGDAEDFDKMVRTYNQVMNFSTGKAPTVDLAHPMVNSYKASDDKRLAKVGEQELYNIARRYAARFPGAFKKSYNPESYKFTSTCKSRTILSGASFGIGAFDSRGNLGGCGSQPVAIAMSPCDHDPILRYYDLCQKYLDEVGDNDTALSGVGEFLRGVEVNEVARKVNQRLGLPKNHTLPTEMMRDVFLVCAFDVALHGKTLAQGWCSLFDESDFNVMEYALDLKAYLKRSTRYPIAYQQSCPLLADMFQSLKAKVDELNSARATDGLSYDGVFRFAHSGTVLPLFALMDYIVEKEHMTAYNYDKMKNRKFRAGLLAPLAGNIGFVLYSCPNQEFKIQMYVNERLVKLPCCYSAVDCPFTKFESYYKSRVENCDLKRMCNNR